MNNKFIKVHQSNLRTRYKYFLLKDEFIDENILKNYFLQIFWRINGNCFYAGNFSFNLIPIF